MGTPSWLLKLVMAFLEGRSMILKYKGCTSKQETLPGGGPQGTKLGLYLFLILINGAGYEPNQICKDIGVKITSKKRECIPQTQQKYIDDMTQSQAIDLKKVAISDPNPNPVLPRQFHERTGHILPSVDNQLQEQMRLLRQYAKDNGMVINEVKCKLMIFNRLKSVDVLPQLEISTLFVLPSVARVRQ